MLEEIREVGGDVLLGCSEADIFPLRTIHFQRAEAYFCRILSASDRV